MKIYIASSWKNQHAVEMLTALLREKGHEVLSFVENNYGEGIAQRGAARMPFEQWVYTDRGARAFEYDTKAATTSDLVIYISPSGCDAWAEVGAAWASNVPIIQLSAKGEQIGLMRRMILNQFDNFKDLLVAVETVFKK